MSVSDGGAYASAGGDMPSSRDTQLVGRFWPTEKRRPHESVFDWCRRLDDLVNPRTVSGSTVNPGVEGDRS